MPHSQHQADRWLKLVLEQPLPGREILVAHVAAGWISSLCTCGCRGFGFTIPEGVDLQPLGAGSGLFCELAFHSNAAEEIDVLLFTDARGYFSGADVTYGHSNVEPMPGDIEATGLIGVWPRGKVAEA